MPDRRNNPSQPIVGGHRRYDPPLTTEVCAFLLGVSSEHIRSFIDHGVRFEGRVVKLKAEQPNLNGKRFIRIYRDELVTFLHAIGWSRIPDDADFERLARQANRANRANQAN